MVESACSILAREKDARGSSLVDNSKNTPTAGKKASIPGLIQIIKSKVVENPSPSSSLRTTNTKSQSEFGGRKCIDKSSIDYVKSILHLHFPEEYVATFNPETTMFDFGGIASVKFSIVKTIIGWNIQPAFNNILYDDRFVGILLTYVVGKENLANNYLPKEQIRFIRSMCMNLYFYIYMWIVCYFELFLFFSDFLTAGEEWSASFNTFRRIHSSQSDTRDGK